MYRSELAVRLSELGYEIEHGQERRAGDPGLQRGVSRGQRVRAASRSKSIWPSRESRGAGAAQIAAHQTRDAKLASDAGARCASSIGRWLKRSAISRSGRSRRLKKKCTPSATTTTAGLRHAQSAVTFARDRNMEREAVVDERALMRDALKRSMGQASFEEVRSHFQERVEKGDLIEVKAPSRPLVHHARNGRAWNATTSSACKRARAATRPWFRQHNYFEHLSDGQRQAVETILDSRDQITGLQGVAGAGKTTSLAALREAAEREGYRWKGSRPRRGRRTSLKKPDQIDHAAAASRPRRERPRRRRQASLLRR